MRILERELYRVFIDDLHRVNEGVDRSAGEAGIGTKHSVKIELHRFGVKFCAVVKLHAFFQTHRVSQSVGTALVPFGEKRHRIHVFIKSKEPFVNGSCHGFCDGVGRIVAVECCEGCRQRNRNVFGLCGRRGSKNERSGRSGSSQGSSPLSAL